jgi:hypothetical protein
MSPVSKCYACCIAIVYSAVEALRLCETLTYPVDQLFHRDHNLEHIETEFSQQDLKNEAMGQNEAA